MRLQITGGPYNKDYSILLQLAFSFGTFDFLESSAFSQPNQSTRPTPR